MSKLDNELASDVPVSDVIEEIKTNIVANNVEIRPVIKKTYVVLDRRFRSEENASSTVMTWYLHNEKGKPEGAYISNQVKKIKAIKILDFSMGIDLFDIANTSKNTLRVLINELSAQSNIVDDGALRKNYHFIGNVYKSNYPVNVGIPIISPMPCSNIFVTFDTDDNDFNDASATCKNQNKYVFDPPINILEKISIQLDFIDTPIIFPKDKFTVGITSRFTFIGDAPFSMGLSIDDTNLLNKYRTNWKGHLVILKINNKSMYDPIGQKIIKWLETPEGWAFGDLSQDSFGTIPLFPVNTSEFAYVLTSEDFYFSGTADAYINLGEYSIELEIDYT